MSDETDDLARSRAEFFRRTRRVTGWLYASLAAAAALLLAAGIAKAAMPAVLAFIAATVLMVALLGLGALIPTSAKTTRLLLWSLPVVGVIAGSQLDLNLSTPVPLGAMAGVCTGLGIGVALIRRRLAHDDDLLRRQQRLGFEPERPWAWLRGGRDSS
jgi:peptidoglycan/LPS O-acetylase OafA/YrhL